jgi:hypothetical protein
VATSRTISALGGIPVADFGNDGYVRVVLHHVVEAAAAQLRDILSEVSGDLQNLALSGAVPLFEKLHDSFGRLLSGEVVVRKDRHVDLAAGGRAIDREEGDIGVLGGLHRLADAGAVVRHGDDRIDLLGNEVVDVVELFLSVAARRRRQDFPALRFSPVDQPRLYLRLGAHKARRRIADDNLFVLAPSRRRAKHRKHQTSEFSYHGFLPIIIASAGDGDR